MHPTGRTAENIAFSVLKNRPSGHNKTERSPAERAVTYDAPRPQPDNETRGRKAVELLGNRGFASLTRGKTNLPNVGPKGVQPQRTFFNAATTQ